MKLFAALTFVCLLMVPAGVSAQCMADSVITYRFIAGKNRVASIEYFTFDEKDSVVSKTLVEFVDGKALPLNQINVRYLKEGPNKLTEYETRNWIAERGSYKATSRHTQVKNKKGQLISEKYDKVEADVVPESQVDYTYSKAGQLIQNDFKNFNSQTKTWVPVTRIIHTYTGKMQTESITYQWDTLAHKWQNDWKLVFAYDSLNELSETLSYQFRNGAWVPKERTTYGKEPGKPVKWSLVQEWNGAKENWVNRNYYVFQLDENGRTQKEIHLDWVDKEWKINTSFNYVYNEAGMLVQILNEANEVMVNRFCRN